MRKSRTLTSAMAVLASCAVVAGLSGLAFVDADDVNAADAVAAIRAVVPETLSGLAAPSNNGDTAVEASTPAGTVEVPVDPADGLALGGGVQIGLPFAEGAADAADSPVPGVVAFDNKNGSTTVPVIGSDGLVSINTVIENAAAPRLYDYPIEMPAGSSLTQDANGTVAVVDADGSPLRVFGQAWAKDAEGAPVATHYEVNGSTLTQVVEFTEQTKFPVVADPSTGVYSYNCVLTTGRTSFMKPNENLTNCKGSYLQKYINGRMVQSIALVYRGGADVKVTWKSGCILALGTTGAGLVFSPPTGGLAWFVTGAIAAAGISQSCKGF